MTVKEVSKFLAIVFIALLCTVLAPPLVNLWLSWYNSLGSAIAVLIDLVQIGFLAVLFAGLLVPLLALDSDPLDPTLGILQSVPQPKDIVRYVIYLDNITEASFQYLPDSEEFKNELAAALPDNIMIIRPYSSVETRRQSPQRGEPPHGAGSNFASLQRLSGGKLSYPNRIASGIVGAMLALTINIRDLLVVAISADQRYGRIYNQGKAQVIYNSLINHGYNPGSGVPITLIGLGGGGQIAMAVLTDLKQALNAPIEVISLAGIITGNNNALLVEHLYHLVGDKDLVERLGVILSPRRWKIFFLSYWNRAKHMGKISVISLGPVGHSAGGGPLDANRFLPDGRSYLRQTVEMISRILLGEFPNNQQTVKTKITNYERFLQAAFNRPEYYPLSQSVNPELYRPIASWMGRLILPPQEQRQLGVLFEVHHADPEHEDLEGLVVYLKWIDDPKAISVQSMKKDVHFSEEALYNYKQGKIEPTRVNHWRQVTPLESLAGSRPNDDMIVILHDPVVVERGETPQTLSPSQTTVIYITSEPVQISGRFYGLVKFLQPIQPGSEQFRVVHFNRASSQFDGVEEVVRMPEVIPFENVIYPSTSRDIEKSPLNVTGWYIYGAKNANNMFVVQALAPRALLRLQPQQVIFGKKPAIEYLKKRSWHDITTHKGQIQSVLLSQKGWDMQQAVSHWREGDRALLIHVYGGIGGKKREAAANLPIYFGHFAYGVAQVVREPLTGELRFDIEYHQVYCHNGDALIAGTLSWTRYMGDRQFGWLGIRPVSDILIKLDAVTQDYEVDGVKHSPLRVLIRQLEIMTARYRIGDGTGVTYVGPANNCAQDSNQALYAAIKAIQVAIQSRPTDLPFAIQSNPQFKDWLLLHPEQATYFKQIVNLGTSLKHELLPFGVARADWQNSIEDLGSSLEDSPLKQLFTALLSWRTILPHKASDTVTEIFINQGASVWILSTSQVGNSDPDIAAIAPFTF